MQNTRVSETHLSFTQTVKTKKGKETQVEKRTMHYQADELLDAIARNDAKALRVFEQMALPMIRNLMRKNFKSRLMDEHDIFQEVCLVIWQKKEKGELRITTTLQGLLYSICKNKYLSVLKKAYSQGNEDADEAWKLRETPIDKLPVSQRRQVEALPEEESFFYGYSEEHLDQVLWETLADEKLNRNHRELLFQTHFTDESQAELADRLGYTNRDNVKVQLSKFRNGPFKNAFLERLHSDTSAFVAA